MCMPQVTIVARTTNQYSVDQVHRGVCIEPKIRALELKKTKMFRQYMSERGKSGLFYVLNKTHVLIY